MKKSHHFLTFLAQFFILFQIHQVLILTVSQFRILRLMHLFYLKTLHLFLNYKFQYTYALWQKLQASRKTQYLLPFILFG